MSHRINVSGLPHNCADFNGSIAEACMGPIWNGPLKIYCRDIAQAKEMAAAMADQSRPPESVWFFFVNQGGQWIPLPEHTDPRSMP